MKRLLVIALVLVSGLVNGQSLKDLLFSGKMKNDSNTVHRKGEDLKEKIDTTTKKPAPAPEKPKVVPANIQKDSTAVQNPVQAALPPAPAEGLTPKEESPAALTGTAKDNNKIWKEFVDTVLSSIKAESMQNKKVKKGDYSVMVDYAINTDGTVTVGNIFVSPDNEFLRMQLKERLSIDTPKLNPVLNSAGVARKTNRRYSFLISK